MTTPVTASPLALLAFDDTWLVLPLTDVATVERTTEMRYGDGYGRSIGRLTHAGRRYAVYGFSPRLRLLSELPPQHLFCACLAGPEGQLGVALACNTVTPINLSRDDVLQPLPECMRRTGAPLQHLLKRGQQLMPVTTAAALTAYIASLEKADGRAHE